MPAWPEDRELAVRGENKQWRLQQLDPGKYTLVEGKGGWDRFDHSKGAQNFILTSSRPTYSQMMAGQN